MKTIKVNLKSNPYNIYIDYNLTKRVPDYIKKLNPGNQGLIVTSSKVYSLYKNKIKSTFGSDTYKVIVVPNGEPAKTKECLFKIINELLKIDVWGKQVFVVCLGGGTVGDLGGFAASIYKRGIPCIQIPTTLLSQIDASIGGKTGIDLKEAKNILGAFHQPKAVFIDPSFLKTLPNKELNQGIAEAIKYGTIRDKALFNFLEAKCNEVKNLDRLSILKVITTCVSIKAEIVQEDEKEKKGVRTILNFGHTLGHALEASLKYKTISHGDAISLGMIYAAKLSYCLGLCKKTDVERIYEIIKKFSLPTAISFNSKPFFKALTYDKKFITGKIRMVLLRGIGRVDVVNDIALKKIKNVIKSTRI